MRRTEWRKKEGGEAYRVFIKEWVKILGNGRSSPIHWQTGDHTLESSRKDETFTTDADPLDVGHPEGVKPPVLLGCPCWWWNKSRGGRETPQQWRKQLGENGAGNPPTPNPSWLQVSSGGPRGGVGASHMVLTHSPDAYTSYMLGDAWAPGIHLGLPT